MTKPLSLEEVNDIEKKPFAFNCAGHEVSICRERYERLLETARAALKVVDMVDFHYGGMTPVTGQDEDFVRVLAPFRTPETESRKTEEK